jgi:Oxidoreductase family, NAD-binding Rossmann fold
MGEPLKIGFLGGAGRASSLWSTLFTDEQNEDKIHPQAVLDINPETANNWRYKVDTTTSDLDTFLNEDLDLIIIGTPPSTHASLAIKCLEAGINVWSEVPMGLTMEELWGIIDAQKGNKGNKGRYALGENYCYFIQPQFMAKQHSEDKIGDIYYSEGEYTHSVEHYMTEENFLHNKKLDPELAETVTPTWRADFTPIKYGHALGPSLYVLNNNSKGIVERPVEVQSMGNMKMQKRFNTDNFNIATVKTDQDTILKYVIGFVLGSHGRIFYSFWGSRGLFMGGSYQSNGKHYYYEVPKEKGAYPDRHEGKEKILSDKDLKELGTPNAAGGHGGSDTLMFRSLLKSLMNNEDLEINAFRGAEMTAPGILAVESMKAHKNIEIPRFE